MAPLARSGRPNELRFGGLVAVAAAFVGGVYAFTAYAVSPFALPAAVLVLTVVVVTFARPAWGLAGALVAVPMEAIGLTIGGGGLSPSEGVLALVGVAWVWRVLVHPDTVVKPQLRDTPLLLLLGVIAIGIAIAQEPGPVLRVFVLWTLFYFVYLQVQSFSDTEMRLVVIAFLLGAAVLGGIGALDYLRSGNQTLFAAGELTGARAAGTFADPNYYASLLVLALMPALALVLADVRRYSVLAPACAVTFAGIALSLSRGGLVGFFGGALLLLAWKRARWVAVGLVLVFTVLTFANANPLVGNEQVNVVEKRLSTLSAPELGASNRRPEIWAVARGIAAQHPFFGVGVNQFQFEAGRRNLTQYGAPFENAHSVFFSLAAETGLIGLAAFTAFLIQLAARAARGLRTEQRMRYALTLGCAAALLGFVLQGLTVAQIRVPVIAGTFFVLAGTLTALADRAGSPSEPST